MGDAVAGAFVGDESDEGEDVGVTVTRKGEVEWVGEKFSEAVLEGVRVVEPEVEPEEWRSGGGEGDGGEVGVR